MCIEEAKSKKFFLKKKDQKPCLFILFFHSKAKEKELEPVPEDDEEKEVDN